MGCAGGKEADERQAPYDLKATGVPTPQTQSQTSGSSGFPEMSVASTKGSGGPARRVAFSSGKTIGGSSSAAPAAAPRSARPKTSEEIVRLEFCVKSMMLFSEMSHTQKKEIFDAMFDVTTTEGEVIIRQGEIGDILFLVESGEYDAYLRAMGDQVVQSYSAGGFFGELAMMYNCPRAATIMCRKGGCLWGLARNVYEKVMATSVVTKMDSKSQFLRSVELLSSLSEAERSSLGDLLEEATYENKAQLWNAGDPADCLILIKSGQVGVMEPKQQGGESARLGDGKKLNVGDFFGTQSLTNLQDATPKRRVGGVAIGKVDVYKLHRAAASKLGDLPELIVNNSAVKAMRNVEWITSLSPAEKLVAVKNLGKFGYTDAQTIVSKGDLTGQGMHIIVAGNVSVKGGPPRKDGRKSDMMLGVGEHFCQETLTEKGPSPAHYMAVGQVMTVMIDRAALRELSDHFMNHPELLRVEQTAVKIELRELQFRATLGVGGFGRVKLVYHDKTNKSYALKCMFKGLVIAKRQTEHILNERKLMGICTHTFLPHLVATFQDDAQIYVLMDLILGGVRACICTCTCIWHRGTC